MSIFQESISEKVWDTKYRYRSNGKVVDQTIEDTWARIAKDISKVEQAKNAHHWQQEFYDALTDFRFLPGGRIMAGAGTHHNVTLFNCFVMPILEDSLTGIFDSLKEAALTLQQGGGVGYDFSLLRPRGFNVLHTGSTASGPVSFMRIWDSMCATMGSTGTRHGAMKGILRCDHPDIEEFIKVKSDPHELRHFNVSVLVTDTFMQAVSENREWELIFPTQESDVTDTVMRHWSNSAEPIPCRIVRRVNARELWQNIVKSAYEFTEPGVLFEDTINRQNNLWYREWISATNPCGEVPLPLYGACNLGAINLTQFVQYPFTAKAAIDWTGIQKTVNVATRFLDNVIAISRYPLKMQRSEAFATRRIGLGITGLADMFIMMGVQYGNEASLKLASQIMKFIMESTWQASIDLAKERGVFAAFHAQKYLQGNFVKLLSEDMRQAIEQHGIRNSHHNTIAPGGTISLLANNISSGLEPVFGADYERLVRNPQGETTSIPVTNYALRLWRKLGHAEKLPPAWMDVGQLSPLQHLHVQAAVQPYIDNAISKTISVPENFPFDQLTEVYAQAYKLGLKGCTIYRPNAIRGSILSQINLTESVDQCFQSA